MSNWQHALTLDCGCDVEEHHVDYLGADDWRVTMCPLHAAASALLAACEAALAEIAADCRQGGHAHGTMATEEALRDAIAKARAE